MANTTFNSYANIMWGSGTRVDWDADTMAAALIDAGAVTINTATHDFYNDINAGAVATVNLASITISARVLDAADPTWTSVSGASAEQVVLYKNTGTASTSDLCILFDAGGFTSGMPVTPTGGNITLVFSGSGIATL